MITAIKINRLKELAASIQEQVNEFCALAETPVDEILSCKESAAYLGVTCAHVSRLLKEGRLHKTSNGVRSGIKVEELNQYKRR